MKRGIIAVLSLLLLTGSAAVQAEKLTIDQCVEIALEQNPQIVMSEFTVKMAGKDVLVSLSNFLPTIVSHLGYEHNTVGPQATSRLDANTGLYVPTTTSERKSWNSYSYTSVDQTLFSGGSNYFNLRRNVNLKKSSDANFHVTKQDIILLVRERYYNLLKSVKLLSVSEETLKSSEESFKRAEVLYQVGKAPKSDVLKAKVQMETDRLAMIQAQNNLAIAHASMNHVLGFDVDQEIEVVDNLEVKEYEIGYDDVMNNALENHPLIQKSMFDLKASSAGIGMSVSRFVPTISASYYYRWAHTDFKEISNMFDMDYRWGLSVNLRIPIFQGFSRVAQLSKAQLLHKSNKQALEQAQRDIALEAKTVYFEVQQAKKKITVTKDALEAAEEDLRLNKEKYGLGAGTMLDLLNAQVSFAQAQSDRIQALYDYKYAQARLRKAMGQLNR